MRIALAALASFALVALSTPAQAGGTYKCKGERIEKGSSTWGYARKAGSDYRIEKGSSSVGWAKKRSSKWAIETFGGSTLGWLVGSRIEKPNGSTWAQLSEAKRMAENCSDAVAAALWVLHERGKI